MDLDHCTLVDLNGESQQEGSMFCIEVTSSDKREKVSITKHPMRFYYNLKGREECWQGNLSTLLSIHCLIMTEKCMKKVELRAILLTPQKE